MRRYGSVDCSGVSIEKHGGQFSAAREASSGLIATAQFIQAKTCWPVEKCHDAVNCIVSAKVLRGHAVSFSGSDASVRVYWIWVMRFAVNCRRMLHTFRFCLQGSCSPKRHRQQCESGVPSSLAAPLKPRRSRHDEGAGLGFSGTMHTVHIVLAIIAASRYPIIRGGVHQLTTRPDRGTP